MMMADRRTFKTFVLFVTLSVSSVPHRGLGQRPDVSAPADATDRPTVAMCKKVAPDAEYFVPEDLKLHRVPSGSGAYGYRQNCPFWVVDFSLNRLANSILEADGSRSFEETKFYGAAYDLPSSSSANGKDPIVKEDCLRLRVEYYIFSKFKHEPEFVFRRHLYMVGEWTGQNTCMLSKDPTSAPDWFKLTAPKANVLVVRVATRVKLRTSWQETTAVIEDVPAN